MVRIVSVLVLAGVVLSAPQKQKKSGFVQTLVQGLGLAAVAETAAVHPRWHSTQNDLGHLLSRECKAESETMCPMEVRFRQWAGEYGKPYLFGSEKGDEYATRFQNFAENVQAAQQFNAESGGEAVYGITKFMDLTEQEFKAQRTGMNLDTESLRQFHELEEVPGSEFLEADASGVKDWSAEGVTTAVKDQGQCGSCWAFSTTEQVESMAIQAGIKDESGQPYVLAPQELVSCDHNEDLGCNGGLPSHALKWLEKKALEQEADYPYTSGTAGRTGTCKMDKGKGVIEVSKIHKIKSEKAMTNYLFKHGPISIGVHANRKWQMYQGGVMEASDCEGQLDHAVQAVGVDTDAGYWKVRNSWAASWGEEGFIRLKYGTNTCGIANVPITAHVKKAGTEEVIV